MQRRTIEMAALAMALCVTARTAGAQDQRGDEVPAGDVTAGLSMQAPRDVNVQPYCTQLSLPCESPRTFGDVGWTLSGARQVTRYVAAVVETGMYDNRWVSWQSDRNNIVRSLAAGIRIGTPFLRMRHQRSPTRLFGQILIGAMGSDDVRGGVYAQPGGGMDIQTPRGFAVRLELDYAFVPGGLRNLSTGRFLLGLVVGVGSREP